jgi:hypothetical protein
LRHQHAVLLVCEGQQDLVFGTEQSGLDNGRHVDPTLAKTGRDSRRDVLVTR